jgi:hypothetical protein
MRQVAAERCSLGRRAPGNGVVGIMSVLAGRFRMCANKAMKGMIQ